MSHHHDHDHGHDHHHDHDHGHDHHHDHRPLSFSAKMAKLLDHWIQHNDHHAEDYRKWAGEARKNSQAAVADQLDAAAELTDAISARFRDAGHKVTADADD
jgi:hypothetical protein